MEHTPLPWVIDTGRIGGYHIMGAKEAHPVIALGLSEANAEFIVKACNSYYELVGQLQSALGSLVLLCGFEPTGWQKEIMDKIQQALAKAEKGG